MRLEYLMHFSYIIKVKGLPVSVSYTSIMTEYLKPSRLEHLSFNDNLYDVSVKL